MQRKECGPAVVTSQHRPFFPLTPLNDLAFFRAHLESLRYDRAFDALLDTTDKTHVVRTGAIRDVVLLELGDNVFIHSLGANVHAHMAMTKLSAPPRRPHYPRRTSIVTPVQLERDYLEKIATTPYIVLVIADKGPGIANTLRTAYESDDVISDHRAVPPSESDLLCYSFSYHSTRRTTEERVGQLAELLSDSRDFPPPTGLYRLADTVRRFGGFLMLRSGSTLLALDGLS